MTDILKALSLTETDALMIPICTVLFFMLHGTLSKLLFRPILALQTERESRTTGSVADSERLREQTQTTRNQLLVKMALAEQAAQRERLQILETAKRQASEIIAEAEHAAAEFIAQRRIETTEEAATLRTQTDERLDELASLVVDRLVSVPLSAQVQ